MDKDSILETIRISALGSSTKSISEIIGINRTSIINILIEHDVKVVKSL